MNIPVFDLHCDTALALLGENLRQCGSLKKNTYHIDLDRAGKLPGYAQCFACFTTPEMERWYGVSPRDVFHQSHRYAVVDRIGRGRIVRGLRRSPVRLPSHS